MTIYKATMKCIHHLYYSHGKGYCNNWHTILQAGSCEKLQYKYIELEDGYLITNLPRDMLITSEMSCLLLTYKMRKRFSARICYKGRPPTIFTISQHVFRFSHLLWKNWHTETLHSRLNDFFGKTDDVNVFSFGGSSNLFSNLSWNLR